MIASDRLRLPLRSAGAACLGRLRLAVILLLAGAGLLLAGQGAWIHAKAFAAQILLDRAFARSVETGAVVRPWPWLDTYPVARIEVPRLAESAVALEGASGQALAFGPAHVAGTPAAGEAGTAVYAAHRDTHFAFLGAVEDGDAIAITRRDGRTVRYRATGHAIRIWNRSGIDPQAPGRHLVLATCWPFGALTHGPLRYLVFADEIGG
ncbi:class GN sortase [Labrys monachus]|uniref:Sortase A n=1 Tax=Labrys monachus TaxID=217067 RepID=A0ABU0FI59_9HYPH|nr:class GN sortase [Labrys monachus]MDQ0394298.1 sortase A [Labrys monachus]